MLVHTDTRDKITAVLVDIAAHPRVVEYFNSDKAKIKRQTGNWRHDLEQSIMHCDAKRVNHCLLLKKAHILRTVEEWILNDL